MNTPAPQVEMVSELQRLSDAATQGDWKMWANELRADPVGKSNVDDTELVATFSRKVDSEGCPHVRDLYFVQALVMWFRDNSAAIQAALNARAGGDGLSCCKVGGREGVLVCQQCEADSYPKNGYVLVPSECTTEMELALSDALATGDYSIAECLDRANAAALASQAVGVSP